MSSKYTHTPGQPFNKFSIHRWKIAGAEDTPKGSLLYWNNPLCVTRHYGAGDHGLMYAIVASACIFFFLGWCGLVCTIAAIFVSMNVSVPSSDCSGISD